MAANLPDYPATDQLPTGPVEVLQVSEQPAGTWQARFSGAGSRPSVHQPDGLVIRNVSDVCIDQMTKRHVDSSRYPAIASISTVISPFPGLHGLTRRPSSRQIVVLITATVD